MAGSKRSCVLLASVLLALVALALVLLQPNEIYTTQFTELTGVYTHSPVDQSELALVSHNIRQCFNHSNMAAQRSDLLQKAVENAEQFMTEYRTVIPRQAVKNHSSHCFPMSFSASTVSWFNYYVAGHINGLPFNRPTDRWFYGYHEYGDLSSRYGGHFASSTVCLPKTYLLGFEKCGSTYFWCFISKVISAYSGNAGTSSDQYHADKEPYFWTSFLYTKSPPDASTIGNPYMLNFMRAVAPEVSSEERKSIMLMDGTPATVIEWPKFSEEEDDLTNYCLLPSTLPQLFPGSKYVVIMREPVSMLYSNFWWSYYFGAGLNRPFISDLLHTREGPNIFHENSVKKIDSFLSCLKDESEPPCPFLYATEEEYSQCVLSRQHLHSKCVYEITHERTRLEVAIHRAIYYVHIQKWLSVLPRDRILFTTLKQLTKEPSKVAAQVLDFFEVDGERNSLPLTDDMVRNVTLECPTNSKGVIDYKNMEETRYPPKDTEVMLKKFFVPFNHLLANLLNNTQFLWNSK